MPELLRTALLLETRTQMPETLYLIDGFAQIFRAYYAIRGGMHSPVTSEPTHAIFGFTGMLVSLLNDLNPHYVAVAFDAPGGTFRDEMYAEYKATRNATPDDLISQIPRIRELIQLFGIPLVEQPGLEADDVMATMVERLSHDPSCPDLRVRMVSKDKDLEQLLTDRVTLFDIHTREEMDIAGLKAKKGISPQQVIDYLALIGDTSDNVPGVPGIGPKTAAELIQTYGSIDGIYQHIDQIKGKRKENLEEARPKVPLSQALVTLKRDADFDFTLESARVRPLQTPQLIALFKELGFNRFQDVVQQIALKQGAAGDPLPTPVIEMTVDPPSDSGTLNLFDAPASKPHVQSTDYQMITSAPELERLVAEMAKAPMLSFDTETTGLESDAKLCGLSFAWEAGKAAYVPVRSPEPERHLTEEQVLAIVRPILEDEAVLKCGHNLKFDAKVMLRSGVRLRGLAFDSMLAGQLMDPSQATQKLDAVALARLGHEMIPITSLIGAGDAQGSMRDVPLDKICQYAAEDADVALQLFSRIRPELEQLGMSALLRDVEAPLAGVLAEMETLGIRCDPTILRTQGVVLASRVEELRGLVLEAAGMEFHLDSPKQLAEVLFTKLGFKPGKKTKTGFSTDSEVLDVLAAKEDPDVPKTAVPRLILEYRQLTKLISTYLGNLEAAIDPRDGRIHTTFHQLVTATGRLASNSPNLQNIPVRSDVGRQIRKAFVAEHGHLLICADYSQVELRLLAHLSGDEALCEAFEKDQDIHTAVASQVFSTPAGEVSREQRNHAKTINFGIIYGVTPFGLSRRIDGLDVEGATQLIADYNRRFPGISRFMQECVQQAMSHGYVSTILGRRRSIPEIMSLNPHQRSLGERLAINSVVQGSGADLIKKAMVNLQRRIDRDKLPMRLLLQIHDELVIEAPKDDAPRMAEIVREEMEQAIPLRVPLRADAGIGADWMSAK